ncbi:SDR family NAD(P)-dependent oxidoreductase [Lysobacter terrae]
MKKALVTGASSGIGAAYADRLARRGYDLVLVARNRERLQELAERLEQQSGVNVELLQADLADPSQLSLIEQRLSEDADIDLLINNAGISNGGTFATASRQQIDAILALNVLAVTRLAAAAGARFARQRAGTIVNIGSVTALLPEQFEPIYLATKAYVLALSQAIQRELAPDGVRVQVVLPGATRTEIWERSGRKLEELPQEILMDVDDMVDAALAGLDMGETVTIPSLPDPADWQAFTKARLNLAPNLSRSKPAARYTAAPPRSP